MKVLGLDIGGANIKAADTNGRSLTRGLAVWKDPERLASALSETVAHFLSSDESTSGRTTFDALAITMTAELADCFQTKTEGVEFVLNAANEVADLIPVLVWQTGAEFVTPDVACKIPLLVAAANWHALATFVGRLVPQEAAVLIDIGTTTADIIPLWNGVPVPTGLTDVDRLQSGELIYTGVRRTPLSAIAHAVPFRGGYCPMAAECFASTLDIYLTLGEIPEDPTDCNTANGKPATVTATYDRLARMLCCDKTEFTFDDAQTMVHFLADVQKQHLAGSLDRVLLNLNDEIQSIVICGAGDFIARKLIAENVRTQSAHVINLADTFSPKISETACAFAVAWLASERSLSEWETG